MAANPQTTLGEEKLGQIGAHEDPEEEGDVMDELTIAEMAKLAGKQKFYSPGYQVEIRAFQAKTESEIKKGIALYEAKAFDEAEKCFKALLYDNNDDKVRPLLFRFCGDCKRKKCLYEEALEFYNKADELSKFLSSSDLAAMLNNRGLIYIELKEYQKALEEFDKAAKIEINGARALYMCNKGQVCYLLGDRKAALDCFEIACDIVEKGDYNKESSASEGGLREDQANYIQTRLNDFVKELEELDKIVLKIPDEIFIRRETKYIVDTVKGLYPEEQQEEKDIKDTEGEKDWEEFTKILDSKQKLELIQDNVILYQYYDGFLYTLSQGYVVATAINSDRLVAQTSNRAVSAVTTLVSLIPLIGSGISEGINEVWNFVKDVQVKRAAVNVCSFATTVNEFESMSQEVAIDIILQKEREIETLDPEKYLLPSWRAKFKKFIEKLDASIYGERNQTAMQKLGYQTASVLIEKYIASGEIYDKQPPVCLLPKQKKSKLLEISTKLLDKHIEDCNKEYDEKEELQGNKEPIQRSACCALF